jgi:small subunit ribosomal protein S20
VAKRTASAKKQARGGARRSIRNRSAKSAVKTLITKARQSLLRSGGEASEKTESTVEAIRALDRAAAKRILHRNNASRRKSRLARQLAKVAAAAPAPSPAPAAKGKKGAAPAPSTAPSKKK